MDEGAGTTCTCTGSEVCSLCPVEEAPEPYDGIMWGDDD